MIDAPAPAGGMRALPPIPDRLIVALDVETIGAARDLVARLDGVVSFFKIGLWLFFEPGVNGLIDEIVASGKQVFLDYKMFDIGETVRRGVASASRRGISFLTVHGDDAIMRAAVEGRGDTDLKVFAISVLTSMDDSALHSMGYAGSVQEVVERRVRNAVACGVDGIIASPNDQPDRIRALTGADGLLVTTPGIRLVGEGHQDQKRAGPPDRAIADGADYLVVGRPITGNADPASRALVIIAEMERGWAQRSGT